MTRCARTGRAAAAATALALLAGGCGDETSGPSGDDTVAATFVGFPESSTYLGHLELWISFAEARGSGASLRHATSASAGKFKILGGIPVGLDYQPITFRVDPSDPDVPVDGDGNVLWQLAVDAFVSIETDDDPLPDDPGAVFLGGAFLNGAADLAIDHGDALGDAFAPVSGSFQLATPSTSGSGDESEGCWFAAPGATPAASLSLPELSSSASSPQSRWIYEGWISLPSAGLASLGAFRSPLLPDGDLDGPLRGLPPTDGPGFPFPGSDFPYGGTGVDLSAGSVIVTLEPLPDPDPSAPFFLEILGGPVPPGAVPGVSYPLAVQTAVTFPGATVTVPVGR